MKRISLTLLFIAGIISANAQQTIKIGINPLPVLRGMSSSIGHYDLATRFQVSVEKEYKENASCFFALAYMGPLQKSYSYHYSDPTSYNLSGIRMDLALRKYTGSFYVSPGILWEHTGLYEKGSSSGTRSDRFGFTGSLGKQISLGGNTLLEVYSGLELGWDFLRSYDKEANEKYDPYSLPLIRPMCGVRLVLGNNK